MTSVGVVHENSDSDDDPNGDFRHKRRHLVEGSVSVYSVLRFFFFFLQIS